MLPSVQRSASSRLNRGLGMVLAQAMAGHEVRPNAQTGCALSVSASDTANNAGWATLVLGQRLDRAFEAELSNGLARGGTAFAKVPFPQPRLAGQDVGAHADFLGALTGDRNATPLMVVVVPPELQQGGRG